MWAFMGGGQERLGNRSGHTGSQIVTMEANSLPDVTKAQP